MILNEKDDPTEYQNSHQYKSRSTIVSLNIQAHDNIEINIDLSSTSFGQSLTKNSHNIKSIIPLIRTESVFIEEEFQGKASDRERVC